ILCPAVLIMLRLAPDIICQSPLLPYLMKNPTAHSSPQNCCEYGKCLLIRMLKRYGANTESNMHLLCFLVFDKNLRLLLFLNKVCIAFCGKFFHDAKIFSHEYLYLFRINATGYNNTNI